MNRDNERIPLCQAIREQVARDSLDPGELARLRRLAEGAPARPARRQWLSVAAAIGGSAVLGYWGISVLSSSDNAQRLADEIAYNHLANAPLDIASNRFSTLQTAFSSLGFNLLDPHRIYDLPGELVGGRFCSVASVPAALLRYRSDRGVGTVYQARFDPERHRGAADLERGQARVVRHARGVSVCLCQVEGVLLALADTTPSSTS